MSSNSTSSAGGCRHVPVKDFYTVDDVSALLRISVNRVYELVAREGDPMPFRRLIGSKRGMFVSRHELSQWVMRNTDLAGASGRNGAGRG